jgi:hypothetical protein
MPSGAEARNDDQMAEAAINDMEVRCGFLLDDGLRA